MSKDDNKSVESRDLFQSIVEAVSATMNLPACIWVLDEEAKALRIAAAVGLRPVYMEKAILKLDEVSVTGEAFETGEPSSILDVTKDPRWKYKDEAKEMGWKSALSIPLKLRGKVLGVISVYTFVERVFSPLERELLGHYASQVEIALQRARERETLEKLIQIGQSIEEIVAEKPDLVLEQIVRGACGITGADCAVVYPYDSLRKEFYDVSMVAHYGLRERLRLTEKPRTTGGMAAYVNREGEVVVNDIEREDPKMLESPFIAREGVKAFMGFSLKVGEEIVGVLYINFREPHMFSEEEKNTARLFTHQASIAIYNTRLYEQARSRAEVLTRLSEIGQSLVSIQDSPQILETTLRRIAENAQEVLDADLVDLYQYTQEQNRFLLPPIMIGERKHRAIPVKISDDVVMKIVREEKPQYFEAAQSAPLLSSEFETPREDAPEQRFAIREGIQSSAAIPLKIGDETVGVMFVNYRKPMSFTDERRERIELFANQAAIAIQNARLFEETTKRAEGVAFANEVGRLLSATRDIKEIPRLLVGETLKAFDAEAGSLALINAKTKEIEFQFALDYKGTEKLDETMKGYKMPLDKGIAGAVVQSRVPVISNNVQEDSRWHKEVDSVTGFTTKSILAVPLIYSDQVIGVIEILNKRDGSSFLEQEKDCLTSLALSAAIAIENARLFEQVMREREERIEAIREIGFGITAGVGLTEVLENLLQRTIELVKEASVGEVWLLDEETGKLVIRATQGKVAAEVSELSIGEGIVGWVAKSGEAYLCGNIEEDPHFVRRLAGTQSELAVPLLKGKQVIGVLNVEHPQPQVFVREDSSLLEAIASQVVVAVENARLFQELSERARRLEWLQKVTTIISSEAFDPQKVLRSIVESLSEIFRGAPCAMRPYYSKTNEFGHRVGTGGLTDELVFTPRPDGASCHVVNTTIPLYVENPSVALPDGQPAIREELVGKGVRAIAYLPLLSKGDMIGILYVNLTEPHQFSEDDKRVLELFADQAAIVLAIVRTYEHNRQQLEALREIVGAIGTEADPLPIVLQETVKLFGAEYGAFSLVDSVAEQWISRAIWEKDQMLVGEQIPAEKRTQGWDVGITGYAAQTGQAHRTGDVKRDHYYMECYESTASELAVPLKDTNGKVIGVLGLGSPVRDAFSQTDEDLCQNLANVAATAVEKAQLFETMQRLNIQLESLHQLSQEQSLEDALDQTLKSINAILGERTSSGLRLYDEKTDSLGQYRTAGPLEDSLRQLSPRPDGTGRHVLGTGEPLYLDDVHNPPKGCPTAQAEIIAWGIRSFAALPLKRQKQMVGVLFINLQKPISFSEEIRRILELFASQAAVAIENARLYRDLERRIRQLEVLPGIYEKIIAAGIEDIDRISDLLYKEASKVLDLSNAQVQIAFHDEAKDEVSFPLAVERDNGKTIDVVRWSRREALYREEGEAEIVKQFRPRARRVPPGLNEYVIRTKKPLLIVEDFEQKAAEKGIKVWPTFGRLDRPTHSWMGVPMMVGSRVIGVISIQSLEQERAFDEGQQELLATVASQAAVAIENARLYQEARSEVIATKQLATLGIAIAALQHRINNSFNIIVPNVTRLRKRIDMTDETHVEILDIIERNARYTSNIIARIQEPLREIEIQDVDVNAVLSDVVGKAREQWLSEPDRPVVEVVLNLDDSIPRIPAPIGQIAEVFRNLIDNAYRAMEKGGQLVVTSDRAEGAICVRVRDRGPGIPLQVQERLFVKPVPSNDPSRGAGLGLWLSRLILQSIGGNVIIETSDATGTTMLVEIPVPGTGVQTPSLGAGVEVQS